MIRNNLMLSTEALDIPEAIDFDGTNDYLSRSSDLVGNADGKAFTFSAWVWIDSAANGGQWVITNENQRFYLSYANGGTTDIVLIANNTANSAVLQFDATSGFADKSFNHILISVDLTSSANRAVYINGAPFAVSWTHYANDSIDFTRAGWGVGARQDGVTAKMKGRLSHLFLAYEYIDLSIESNRRIFITADRKPA